MALKIASSITGGIERVTNRTGVALLAGYTVLGLAWQLIINSIFLKYLQDSGIVNEATGMEVTTSGGFFGTTAPLSVLGIGAVICFLALTWYGVFAIRTINANTNRLNSNYLTRNIGYVLANSLLGGIVLTIVISVGSILLFIPGIIAYVAFLFVPFLIAIEDRGFIDAFRESWAMTRGNWLKLFGLLIIVFIAFLVVMIPSSMFLGPAITSVVGSTIGAYVMNFVVMPLSILMLGIWIEAFNQLDRNGMQA
ncbi:hypothetical protein [Haloferax sulfurifontis]|uniref:DUF7847 domain-containing protein n=1 Tax=Haloferax sulfurifontis ATCC BAA-897 TaxID=662480 RepID=M0IIR5_9EURY|nr:hypothetical protein [Haloferax sulfurifontis]ELZ96681.1 hypothetical protein C441_04044 [Haloferax sulfurifontis ATCC BAA-897]